jgi:hypothetical protein
MSKGTSQLAHNITEEKPYVSESEFPIGEPISEVCWE